MTENTLAGISPFSYLSEAEQLALIERAQLRSHKDGDELIRQGSKDQEVFVLIDGVVSVFDSSKNPERYLGSISKGSYFGERACLFGMERRTRVIANGPGRCLVMSGELFLETCAQSVFFAQALARNLRHKQGLFVPIERFLSELMDSSSRGHVDLESMLSSYQDLSPALHPAINDSKIDVGAWLYAVRRLPENITRAHVLLLSKTKPALFEDTEAFAEPIGTAARRRTVWALSQGKSLVMLRDGWTDLTDFLSLLSLHATEARKVRRRIRSSDILKNMAQLMCPKCTDEDRQRLLERLPFSPDERAGLQKIWPKDLLARLYDILLHHEDYSIYIDAALGNYNADGAELWTQQIRVAAEQLMGPLEDLEVDIVSSNTHSVVNCLSPYLHEHREDILAWGQEHLSELASAHFHNDTDRLYAMSYHYFKAHPEEAKARRQDDAKRGMMTLTHTEFTGLQVDLIDLSKLPQEGLDPSLCFAAPSDTRRLLINIDYAFGCQAEDILRCLVLLFGKSIRSINILGKAGALTGRRGDILMPESVLHQKDDEIIPVGNDDLDAAQISQMADVDVHCGPVLTVTGTLLQNRVLLRFYKTLWRCVGLEMEGSYYAREIRRSQSLGMLREDLKTRFLYYVSDLPLNEHSNLSARLAPWEGIPPLYATTRAVLSRIVARGS